MHLQAGSPGSRNHNEASRTRIEECLEKTPEGRARKDCSVQRHAAQRTRELERQDVLISKNGVVDAKAATLSPEGELERSMKADEDIVLQLGLRRDRDASLPDVDNAMDSDPELEPGLGARAEAIIPLAQREPAHARHREASSSSGDRAVCPRLPEPSSPTVSYRSGEVD